MVTTLPPLTIVYYTLWFGQVKFRKRKASLQDKYFNSAINMHTAQDENVGLDCPFPEDKYAFDFNHSDAKSWCTLTSSESKIDHAAGLMFHAPNTITDYYPQHRKNQPWVLETLETPFSSPFRAKNDSMKDFDYLASYNFKSAFLFSYYSPAIMDVVNRPLPKDFIKTKNKKPIAPILWIAHNCGATNKRESYIEQLSKYIDIDFYGSCLNNKPFPKDKSRLDLMREYKFYLAIENSNCEDYVTEKTFDTLTVSSIPIIDGPSSYEGFLPNSRSAIHMDAYPDPRDLADYIQYLHNNDTAYLQYFNYRQDAITVAAQDRLDAAFIQNWADSIEFHKISSYCGVCRGLLPWHEANINNITYIDTHKDDHLIVDISCMKRGKWEYAANGPPYIPDWTPRPKDEFTRVIQQVFNDTTSIDDVAIPVIAAEKNNINITIWWAAHFSFITLFILFIAFLIRESRKHRNDNNITEPASDV